MHFTTLALLTAALTVSGCATTSARTSAKIHAGATQAVAGIATTAVAQSVRIAPLPAKK